MKRPTAGLTPRELDVLRHIALGQNNTEMAATLHITRETVKTHVGSVLGKLGARDRTQAAVLAYELGLIFPGTDGPGRRRPRSSPG